MFKRIRAVGRALAFAAIILLLVAAGAGAAAVTATHGQGVSRAAAATPTGIHKIKHVVIIMQENRSFDNYFGTYPGADGIPMKNGVPTVCVPMPASKGKGCVRPYHDRNDLNLGGPHGQEVVNAVIDGGKMDGFIKVLVGGQLHLYPDVPTGVCSDPFNPKCTGGPPDVMGYHTGQDLPNYWAYAKNFVLQDHMFAPVTAYSLVSHLYMVSAWSAVCSTLGDPKSCKNSLNPQVILPSDGLKQKKVSRPNYAWTDITYLLSKAKVSWKYYVDDKTTPYCTTASGPTCVATPENGTPALWNTLPFFTTVQQDGQKGNIQGLSHLYADAKSGRLPQVSWVMPNGVNSEHPAALLTVGMAYVTNIINALMKSPDWDSTAIFLAWDDWGGFYDNLAPPKVDQNGYGIRVPALLISPYAKKGYIDHQTLSFDAYLTFIEDDFLGGQRLDPKTDGRPDPRPDVRENVKILGDLTKEFDFTQPPRKSLILSPTPKTDLLEPSKKPS